MATAVAYHHHSVNVCELKHDVKCVQEGTKNIAIYHFVSVHLNQNMGHFTATYSMLFLTGPVYNYHSPFLLRHCDWTLFFIRSNLPFGGMCMRIQTELV